MRKFFLFIRFGWKLLKMNLGTLLVFELLYKFTLLALAKPLLMGMVRITLKFRGLAYLSDETVSTYLQGPLVWVGLFVIALCVTFVVLFDICCIITCLHASYRNQKIPLLALMRKGALAALRVFYRKNWLMILYILIIIPATHVVLLSGFGTSFELPEFIMEFIFGHKLLMVAYFGFWIFMAYKSFRWIYSTHYFCLEKCSFKEARAKSWGIMKGHFVRDIVILAIWNLVLIGIYYGAVMGGSYLISAVNRAFVSADLFSSLTLSGISTLLGALGAWNYIACQPLVYLGVSLLYYHNKAILHEPIPGEFKDLDDAYRLTDTGWAKKLYQYRKRIIALAVIVVLGVNFTYSLAERKGVLGSSINEDIMVTAHRGYSAVYPENTMAACIGAVEIGADCMEIDVQQTKDGEIIVMHDSNLKRTTGVDANIWETNYEDLKYLDAGSWFDVKYKEETVPTLEQVLEYARGKIWVNIELKPTGNETDFEKAVLEIIEETHTERMVYVSSMKYECLEKVKQINPDIKTVYITSVSFGNYEELAAADGYSVEASMLTQKFVNRAHNDGKEIHVWTVNKEDSMEQVMKMDIDAIITDKPEVANELIYKKTHGTWWDEYIDKLLNLT